MPEQAGTHTGHSGVATWGGKAAAGGTLNTPAAFTLQMHQQSPGKVLDKGILVDMLTCCSQARD